LRECKSIDQHFNGKTDAVPTILGFASHYGDLSHAFVEISGMQAV